MVISIHISDSVYKTLLSGSTRVQGSIGLVSPAEGNFNAHNRKRDMVHKKSIKLAHGRASVTPERVSLTLRIDRSDDHMAPYEVIDRESFIASDFVYSNL